jgi:hypothetical protein
MLLSRYLAVTGCLSSCSNLALNFGLICNGMPLAQITLGCFAPPGEPEPVEDQCCDDALDNQAAPPIRGKCQRTLERCLRPATNFLCAKDDDRDGTCSDRDTAEWPLCAPRNLV